MKTQQNIFFLPKIKKFHSKHSIIDSIDTLELEDIKIVSLFFYYFNTFFIIFFFHIL